MPHRTCPAEHVALGRDDTYCVGGSKSISNTVCTLATRTDSATLARMSNREYLAGGVGGVGEQNFDHVLQIRWAVDGTDKRSRAGTSGQLARINKVRGSNPRKG